jgi:mRNA interferase RelE/StbE
MASYKVEISKNVRKKDLLPIPKSDVIKIVKRIESLAENPFPEGAVRLKGREEWRIRQGNYRILYVVEHDIVTVFVVKVGHRREIYKSKTQ